MAQYITMSVATILVLANIVFTSSALQSYDVKDLGEKSIVLTRGALVSQHLMAKYLQNDDDEGFIGDLLVGEKHPDGTMLVDMFELRNINNEAFSGTLSFPVGGSVNLMGLFNINGTNVVVCDTPRTLGGPTSVVNVRIAANCKQTMLVIIGTH